MPALNFQARFAPLVESGEKRQTIRKRRKDGRDPKPGDTLYLYTGMRTKACRKLGEAKCREVFPFQLTARAETGNGNVNMFAGLSSHRGGGSRFRAASLRDGTRSRIARLAKADGFSSPEEMVCWFEAAHGLPFEGLLIRW